MSQNKFAAAASSLGYLYQLRWGLLNALEKHSLGLSWAIAIEGADDVEMFGNSFYEVHQTKHRSDGTKLTNADPDLWKTLRVWAEGVRDGRIDVQTTSFMLVTTAQVSDDFIFTNLPVTDVQVVQSAVERLVAIAQTSKNVSNAAAYKSFLALSDETRLNLVRNVVCAAKSPTIDQIPEKLRQKVRVDVRPEHLEPYLERLEGWWFERCIQNLVGDRRAIEGAELAQFIYDLRDQFQPTNLPIDDDILDMSRPEVEEHLEQIYVRQVLLTQIGNYRLQQAIHDYLRAYSQRSRWLRENIVVAGELSRYEKRLHEEWAIMFHTWKDDLSESSAEEERLEVARKIYRWAQSADLVPIRRDCTEAFVTRGSLHMLADKQEVGWHPDYVSVLRNVLEGSGSVGGE